MSKIYAPGEDILFAGGPFLASAVPATGLTVTVDVYRAGNTTPIINDGAAVHMGGGMYKYTLDGSDETADDATITDYVAVFITTGTADLKSFADRATVDPRIALLTDIDAAQTTGNTTLAAMRAIMENYPGVEPGTLTPYDPIGAAVADTLGAGVLSPTNPVRTNGVWLQAQVQNIYWTMNGTTPTTSLGFLLVAAAPPIFVPTDGGKAQLKFLRASSGAILQRQYVRIREHFDD